MGSSALILASVGIFIFLIGIIIYKFKAVHLLTWYKPEKYDENKLSKISGSGLLFVGLWLILGSVFIFALPERVEIVGIMISFGVIVAVVKSIYHSNKYAKK